MVLLRRQRRPLARLALFAFLCGWMLPFYEAHPLGLADDAACLVAPAGDTTPPKLEAPVAGEGQPSHCYVCHLMRALNGAIATAEARLAAPLDLAAGPLLADSFISPAVLAAPSTRGPPASLSI